MLFRSSDYRLKENIQPLQAAAQAVQLLNPVTFNYIGHNDEHVSGFIAHELQSVIPEAVTGEKDGMNKDGTPNYQGVDQSKLVPLLTAALQETITELQALKAEVAALKGA